MVNLKEKINSQLVKQYKLYFMYEVLTGKVFYIGVTKKSLEKRMSHHIYSANAKNEDGSFKWKYRQANKLRYLIENNIEFKIEALLTFDTRQELNQAEIKYIAWARQIGFDLTNSLEGGIGKSPPSPSEETRQKQRDKMKGKIPPYFLNPERKRITIEKIKTNHADFSGEKNPMFGATGAKCPNSREVQQFTLNGELIATYESGREAAKALGCHPSQIGECANRNVSHAYGFKWRYVKENILVNKTWFKSTPISQYDLQGNLIQTFNSIDEASIKTNSCRKGIYMCVKNKQHQTRNGFKWKISL